MFVILVEYRRHLGLREHLDFSPDAVELLRLQEVVALLVVDEQQGMHRCGSHPEAHFHVESMG